MLTDFGQTDCGQFLCFSVLAKFSNQKTEDLLSDLDPKPSMSKPLWATLVLGLASTPLPGGVGVVVFVGSKPTSAKIKVLDVRNQVFGFFSKKKIFCFLFVGFQLFGFF